MNESRRQYKAEGVRERNKGKKQGSRLRVEREHERDEDKTQTIKEDWNVNGMQRERRSDVLRKRNCWSLDCAVQVGLWTCIYHQNRREWQVHCMHLRGTVEG